MSNYIKSIKMVQQSRSLSLRDETKCFDFEKNGVYYKKLTDNSLMVVRRIYWRTFWKTDKHVQFEAREFYHSYNNVEIPTEVDGMKVVSIEAPTSAPYEGIISNVSFPDTVTTFGTWLACLTNVIFSSSVTDSHYNSIACCNNLTIPSSVKTIGSLFRCNMVTIPSSVIMIQSIEGGDPRCADYKAHDQVLRIDNPNPPTLARNEANEGSVLFVPQGALDAYKNDPQWGKFKRIVEDPTLSTSVAPSSPMASSENISDGKILSEFPELESLINAALADGIVTEKEKQILFKKAQSMGMGLDEFEMRLDARLFQLKKAQEESAKEERLKKEEREKEERERTKMEKLKKEEEERERTKKERLEKEEAKIAALSSQILENRIEQIKQEAKQRIEELESEEAGIVKVKKDAEREEMNYVSRNANSLKEAKNSIEKTTKEKVHNAIVSFPIPNSKDDLLDFMSYIEIKKKENGSDDVIRKKYNQCVEKAIQLFPDEPIVKSIIDKKKKDAEEDEKNTKELRRGCLIKFIIGIGLLLAVKLLFF